MTTKRDKGKTKRVAFSVHAPDAGEVILLGDFNHWDPTKHPMKKDESAAWKKVIMVPPGRYEYKFLVDREWWNDPNNQDFCFNCFGTINNVVVIF
ncbi:MAG: isoamylase early set domain-containing protein [Thermodesulfobacteriota bacterium]|nr:isoamylase early set domain-containing protein [Thermodesulfobacteriota bacterium]